MNLSFKSDKRIGTSATGHDCFGNPASASFVGDCSKDDPSPGAVQVEAMTERCVGSRFTDPHRHPLQPAVEFGHDANLALGLGVDVGHEDDQCIGHHRNIAHLLPPQLGLWNQITLNAHCPPTSEDQTYPEAVLRTQRCPIPSLDAGNDSQIIAITTSRSAGEFRSTMRETEPAGVRRVFPAEHADKTLCAQTAKRVAGGVFTAPKERREIANRDRA